MSPELHPALVHFPIALLLAGALLTWWELFRGTRNQTADFILILGFVSSLAAAWSGDAALARLILGPEATAAAADHERWGTVAAWLAGVALAARWAVLARARRGTIRRAWFIAGAVLWSAAALSALGAGYRGGKMVHRMGVTPAVVPLRDATAPDTFEGFHAAPADSGERQQTR